MSLNNKNEGRDQQALLTDRREFLKLVIALSGGLVLGTSGLLSIPSCTQIPSKWRPVSYPKTLLYNFELFDGVQNRLQKGLILLVENGRIQGVERRGSLECYKDFHPVDLKGRTVLPGLIDNHCHMTVPFMYDPTFRAFIEMNQAIALNFYNCIMSGVTTVRDVGGFPGKINKFRQKADSLEIPGPRVISSLSPIATRRGKILGAPEKVRHFTNPLVEWILGGNYAERPVGVKEIKAACQEMLQLGASWLKTLHQEHSYSYYPRTLPNHSDEGYNAILEIGAEHGVRCALHQPLLSGFVKGVKLGFHTLEHMPMDGIIPRRAIETFIKKGMAIIPTMMAFADVFSETSILKLIQEHGREYLTPEAIRQMTARLKASLAQNKLSIQERRKLIFDREYFRDMFSNQLTNLSRLHETGATIGLGTDNGGTFSGFFGRYAKELEHYVTAGIPKHEILKMATSVNASILGMQDEIGSISKGKIADIIAVRGNPLKNISVMSKVDMVMKGGTFIKYEGLSLT